MLEVGGQQDILLRQPVLQTGAAVRLQPLLGLAKPKRFNIIFRIKIKRPDNPEESGSFFLKGRIPLLLKQIRP